MPVMMAALLLALASPQLPACGFTGADAPRLCAMASVRRLDETLSARLREVLAVTPRPATWRARAAQFRAWLPQYRNLDGKPADEEFAAQQVRDQIAELDKEIAQARTLLPADDAAQALGERCLATWLSMGCEAVASGVLRGPDGLRVAWQLQRGASEEDGLGMGVILWDVTRPGQPQRIGWSFEGVSFQAPRLTEQGLLWVPGRRAGTGEGNADLLFQHRDGGWSEVELASWRDALDRRLPAGLGVWKGVDYDFEGLGAATELWRSDDANCCPTGGQAHLRFAIESDSLKLESLQVHEATGWKPTERR
jgi:hypothetical protein